jgi:RNA polymerase sigma factor, sigma-70 family
MLPRRLCRNFICFITSV